MAQAMTEGVYGRTMQKCPDPAEKCLPLGEGGFAKQRRMRGGRAISVAPSKAFPWGLCPAQRIEIFMTADGSHTIPKWSGSSRTG